MSAEFITIVVGFIGVFIMFFQLNQQMNLRFDDLRKEIKEEMRELRNELKEVETNLRNEIQGVETSLRSEFKGDMNTLEVKLNTLILGLFRNYNYPPEQPQRHDTP